MSDIVSIIVSSDDCDDESVPGGYPLLDNSLEVPCRPTATNFSGNGDRGWGVSEIGQYHMEAQGFNIVQKVVTAFMHSWGNQLDRNELESLAMMWLTLHQEQLMASHSSSQFTAYAYKSLYRKLSHKGQEMKLEQGRVSGLGDYSVEDYAVLKSSMFYMSYTVEDITNGLEAGRVEFFTLVEESCTQLQAQTLLKRYKENKQIKEIALEDDRSTYAVRELLKQGIKNVASKAFRP